MSDIEPNQHVIGILPPVDCPKGGRAHVGGLHLASGDDLDAPDAIDLMDAGRNYFMLPPPGAPAHEAHVETGLPLILQTVACPACGERVLFA